MDEIQVAKDKSVHLYLSPQIIAEMDAICERRGLKTRISLIRIYLEKGMASDRVNTGERRKSPRSRNPV